MHPQKSQNKDWFCNVKVNPPPQNSKHSSRHPSASVSQTNVPLNIITKSVTARSSPNIISTWTYQLPNHFFPLHFSDWNFRCISSVDNGLWTLWTGCSGTNLQARSVIEELNTWCYKVNNRQAVVNGGGNVYGYRVPVGEWQRSQICCFQDNIYLVFIFELHRSVSGYIEMVVFSE
jgi:hypothetical protein